MLFEAQQAFDLDLSRVPFVGDDERDGQAAAAARCKFERVTAEIPLADITEKLVNETIQTGA